MLNLPEGGDEHNAIMHISDTTIGWIADGTITRYDEVRRYHQISFENMSTNIYGTVITDNEHEYLINEQSIEELLSELSVYNQTLNPRE
jgi:hypothetical protein